MGNRYGNPVTDDLARYHTTCGRTHLWWGKVWLTTAKQYGDHDWMRASYHFERAQEHFFAVGMWFTNHGTAMAARLHPDVACPCGPDGIDYEHEPGWTDADAQTVAEHVRWLTARVPAPEVSGSISLGQLATGIRRVVSDG